MTTTTTPRERILSPAYAATTVAMFGLIAFVAFEAMAVATVMPTVARDLDGLGLYALAFAAPLASGVVGMVAAGTWSDRSGPVVPLLASLALFSTGLLVCGLAPSMEVLLVGRVLQGLGGGALTVGLYVVVGLVYPAPLRPAVFASFAAAWVLPALFGPGLAAFVATTWSWRWVFLGAVALVVVALALLAPALRGLDTPEEGDATPRSRLWWAVVGAVAVLVLELLGSATGLTALGALAALALVWVALGRLLPRGSRRLQRGLPAVIATRGLLSAVFFCAEAYIVYVLQDHWDLTAGRAGIALTCVGVVWAASSQLQSRLGERVSHTRAMLVGTSLVLVGVGALALTVLAWTPGHVRRRCCRRRRTSWPAPGWASPTRAPAWRCWRPPPTATAASTPRRCRSPTRSVRRSRSRRRARSSRPPTGPGSTRSSRCSPPPRPSACSGSRRRRGRAYVLTGLRRPGRGWGSRCSPRRRHRRRCRGSAR